MMTLSQCNKCKKHQLTYTNGEYCACGGVLVPVDLNGIKLIGRTAGEAPGVLDMCDTGVHSFRSIAKEHGLDRATVKKILRAAGRI